jgi:uncharacterized protein (DUF302 family)
MSGIASISSSHSVDETVQRPGMIAQPFVAIDLPLKILIAEDANGAVPVSWNTPAYIGERHGLPDTLLQNIAAAETLAGAAGS